MSTVFFGLLIFLLGVFVGMFIEASAHRTPDEEE